MRNRINRILEAILTLGLCAAVLPARAADLSHGTMLALPAAPGHTLKINGSLKGWNLAAADPIWMSFATARKMHALAAMEYTRHALYLGVRVALPDRPMINVNGPQDPFWGGDEVELRLVADPQVAYPVNRGAANVKANPRVCHLSFWKDTLTGKDYLNITHGVKLNLGQHVNPPGSAIKIVEHDQHGYTLTARIPWSALDAPGGIMPFKPGEKMPAVMAVHFGGAMYNANAVFRKDPGDFAFLDDASWGRVQFSPTARVAQQYPPLAKYLARQAAAHGKGVAITVQVPRHEHVSVNIFDSHGRVIRELMTGAVHKKGPLTLYWNGRNQWGAPVALGTYKWGAYFSPGIRAKYIGTVGSSGSPPYPTLDGRGGWGGDHGPAIDAATDKTGLYFLWVMGEARSTLIKLDDHYHTLWRVRPFVRGGFTPVYAVAANGKYAFLAYGDSHPVLARLNAASGQLLQWPNKSTTVSISHSTMAKVPADSSPVGRQPECSGLAATATEVFASVYSKNQIRVLSAQSGRLVRTLSCAGPRGVCLDAAGNLYAVSYVPGKPGRIIKFAHAAGAGHTIVDTALGAPWAVAVDAAGRMHVTDDGASQQVKVFSQQGQLLQTLGVRGGRPWSGKYVAANYLEPAGITADTHGGILSAQAALPKVFSLNDAATGKIIKQWFGGIGYWGQDTPEPKDPRMVYYQLEAPGPSGGMGLARAPVIGRDKVAAPQAYWLLNKRYPGFKSSGTWLPQLDVVVANNGRRYLVCDAGEHGVALLHGNQLLPVAYFHSWAKWQKDNPYHRNALAIWCDSNGDHQVQPGEVHVVSSVAGLPLPALAGGAGSMWMSKKGNIYLVTEDNSIIEIPAMGFLSNGTIQWDLAKARYAVPVVLGRAGLRIPTGYREGILGVRVDNHGNLYACVNATVPYYTKAETKAMHNGIGHDNVCNAVKFMKFAPDGKLLWMAGRKAANQAGQGLLHHFWVIAGLVDNRYIAGGSEWGQIYFYTHDGFYVGALFHNPAQAPLPGPYTFGGEDASGTVKYYPRLNQVWAYNEGMAYRVLGFDHGQVTGQSRQWGHVVLTHVYRSKWGQRSGVAGDLVITPLHGAWDSAAAWKAVPARSIKRGGTILTRVQLALDGRNLYARFKVTDGRPLLNGAHSPRLAFNDGDTVGLDSGPLTNQPNKLVPGDMRILATMINRHPRLIAMVPLSRKLHAPVSYFTPAGGHVNFDFVGYVPGGKVRMQRWAHGYIMIMAVPRKFLGLPLKAGAKLRMDVEVNYSGYTNEGLQVVSRNYLFSPQNDATSMVSDIPTEARLNPQWWGQAVVK